MEKTEQVYVSVLGNRAQPAAPFDVKIDLTVPGSAICVHSERAEHEAHMDVYLALRDAFDAAKRLLQ